VAPLVRHSASGPTGLPLGRVLPTRWVGRTAGLEVLEKMRSLVPEGMEPRFFGCPARTFVLCVSQENSDCYVFNVGRQLVTWKLDKEGACCMFRP
jgi:hypothetical protein